MIKTNQREGWTEIEATEGFLHLKGSDNYDGPKHRPLLPGQTVDDFEELTELPAFTKEQYDIKVDELVRRRYRASEVEGIYRKVLSGAEGATDELAEFNRYVEQCKVEAKNPELYPKKDLPNHDSENETV